MTTYGYARTSTESQNIGLSAQVKALMAVGVEYEQIYTDQFTGKTAERPGYTGLMRQVKEGDKVVFTKIDRMGRSVVMILSEIDRLAKAGIDVRFLDIDLDTSTPMGKMIVTMIGAFAEFERNMISQRTKDALQQISDTGVGKSGQRIVRLGAPNKVDPEAVRLMRRQGETPSDIARQLNISRQTVYNIINGGGEVVRFSPKEEIEE